MHVQDVVAVVVVLVAVRAQVNLKQTLQVVLQGHHKEVRELIMHRLLPKVVVEGREQTAAAVLVLAVLLVVLLVLVVEVVVVVVIRLWVRGVALLVHLRVMAVVMGDAHHIVLDV